MCFQPHQGVSGPTLEEKNTETEDLAILSLQDKSEY